MIYLTGDVHSKSMGGWEQEKIGSELDAAREYIKILKKFEIKCTLFINGKCLDQESDKIKLIHSSLVEIGGHTYNNFGKLGIIRSYIYRKIWGCVYGPSIYQARDIKKTKRAFDKFGLKMNSWRTHAYGSNEKTFEILAKNKVKFVSDLVGETRPFKSKDIVHLPINIPVDNNTISYGLFSPENRNVFASCTKGRIKKNEWFEILRNRVIENEKRKIDSILLIHPATMKCLDNFELFNKIAKFLSNYKTAKISEFKD